MDYPSRSEYLTAITHDKSMIGSLANDCKDICNQLDPTFHQYFNEIDLGIAFLYDIITIFSSKKLSMGQELASIVPFSIPDTTNSWISAIEGRIMKYFVTEKGLHANPRKKLLQFINSHASNRSPPSYITEPSLANNHINLQQLSGFSTNSNNPPDRFLPAQQPPSQTTISTSASMSTPSQPQYPLYQLHKYSPTFLSYSTPSASSTTSTTSSISTTSPTSSTSLSTPRSLEPILQLNLQHQTISQLSSPSIPAPVSPSIFQKLSLSTLSHLPNYIISKTRYNEPIHISSQTHLLNKLYLHLKNILLYYLPQFLKVAIPLFTFTDCILFFLSGLYLHFGYRYTGIGFLRAPNSPLRGNPMMFESVGFKFAGLIMVFLGIVNYGPAVITFMRDIFQHLAKWTHNKAILIYFLAKGLYRTISSKLSGTSISTPPFQTTTHESQNTTTPLTQLSSTDHLQGTNEHKLHYSTFAEQLSPHERHKIRKRLFRYTFELTNVKSGEHYIDNDLFQYCFEPHQINVNAYDLIISSNTDGWSTDNEDLEINDNNKSLYQGIWGLDENDGDGDTKDLNDSNSDDFTIEQYVLSARKNKQLYLHLDIPDLPGVKNFHHIKKHNDDSSFNTFFDHIDTDDEDDDGVLYLNNSINGGYSRQSQSEANFSTPIVHSTTNLPLSPSNALLLPSPSSHHHIQPQQQQQQQQRQQQHQEQQVQPQLKTNCGVCLCRAKATTVTMCGHLFCWGCVIHYVQAKRECPTCRTSCLPSQLLRLYQFG